MTWAFLLIVLVVAGIMTLSGVRQVEWAGKLRRRSSSMSDNHEWMAPDDVVQRVCDDYLVAIEWLNTSALEAWPKQWALAPLFLSGMQLERHQKILTRLRSNPARFVGVMASTHNLEVRSFSEDGERCLVLDRQYQRRITTYNLQSRMVVASQDIGGGATVHQMVYEKSAQRWKIEAFIQELPLSFETSAVNSRIRFTPSLPYAAGRDN